MFEKVERSLRRLLSWVGFGARLDRGKSQMRIIKKGSAMRVIFFYPGEEGTYVDHAHVTLYENGIVHISSHQEETTTHLQNCEILWRFENDTEERVNKVRLLKPKGDSRPTDEGVSKSESKSDSRPENRPENRMEGRSENRSEVKPVKNTASKSPEIVD